jgi:hypothetical protein
LILVVGVAPAQDPKQLPEKAQKALALVNAELQKLKGQGRVTYISDESLGRTFAEYDFVAVLFPQYPVGRQPPEPLKVANVFYVKGGEVKFLTDVRALEQFFKSSLGKTDTAAGAEQAIKCWLRLSQELHQDGFYQFTIGDIAGETKKAGDKSSQVSASGKASVVPKGGNMGQIVATLFFDDNGKVARVTEQAKLVAGVRPICQARRLLDPDPIVRQMAEQAILVMGASARDYLDEQRAQVGPELRAAIDRIWQRIVEEGR